MRLHQTRVCGKDAHAETVRAAFSGGNASLISVIPIFVPFAASIQNGGAGIEKIAVVHFTLIRFNAHMLGIERAEVHGRADIQRFAN